MSNYDDIIHLPHYRSKNRGHMSMQDRAAQFSPFAALTGFEAAIKETDRLTDHRPELIDYGKIQLDQMLSLLRDQLSQCPFVSVTFFIPDDRKSGGRCETISGHLQKIDLYKQVLTLTDTGDIPLADILRIESPELSDPIEP